jgi:SAM-dependent methyltransferase
MVEMTGHDSQRGWDLFYSLTGPVPEQPGPEAQAIVAVLRDLAGDGPVLELAVGDGRIAIPLAASGVEVDGIDISPNGIDKIRAHPQGAAVNASVADISDFALDRKYSLIFCVANSLFNDTTQDKQIRVFELVAAHLAPGGVFVLHSSYTPRWFEGLRNSQSVEPQRFELNSTWLRASRVDPVEQRLYQQDMWLSKDGIKFGPSVHRYASLGELDLMARIAGLRRRELWGGWTREPYTADSPMFLATYGAP